MKFEKINLPYELDALEPVIDKETVDLHYNKHHTGYMNTFNTGIEGTPVEQCSSITEVMLKYETFDDELKPVIAKAGGGLINHNKYWMQFVVNRDLTVQEEGWKQKVLEQFGDFETFKDLIVKNGLKQFGSGWVWAVVINEEIEIITTPNQENPWMQGIEEVILGIDVWEHAYYLKYNSDRKTYIEEVFNLLPYK